MARQEDSHWWYTGMAEIAAGILRLLRLPPGARILDAGCGTGGGLRWLGGVGHACGVDVQPGALRFAQQRGAGRLACADVRALPFADASFDVLTSFDVLCQLPAGEDCVAIGEFARILRPGGWLFLRVPAHNWLRSSHDRFVHSLHRYTRGEVREKLAGAGLQPVRLTYANCILFLPAVVWRLAGRWSRAKSDVRSAVAPLNVLLRGVLRAEAAWLRRVDLPFGLSVLAIARKGGS